MKLNWNLLSKYRSPIYGLCILWVFVFHLDEIFPDLQFFTRIPLTLIQYGNRGVDAFLFLSGISMYYSMKRNGPDIRAFYKKRYGKLLKIYVVFCIPYFIMYYFTGKMSVQNFVKQVTFTRNRISSFWFLLCIFICYTIYPFIYRLIAKNREKWVVGLILAYILLMVAWNRLDAASFAYDELMMTRIPIFLCGCLAGKAVYEKREIPAWLLFTMLFCLIGKDIPDYLCAHVPVFAENQKLISRLFMGTQGVGAVFCMAIFLQYLEGTRIFGLLSKFGALTLEFYVTHIAYMHILKDILGIRPGGKKELILFAAAWFGLSLATTVLLNRILYKPHKLQKET